MTVACLPLGDRPVADAETGGEGPHAHPQRLTQRSRLTSRPLLQNPHMLSRSTPLNPRMARGQVGSRFDGRSAPVRQHLGLTQEPRNMHGNVSKIYASWGQSACSMA